MVVIFLKNFLAPTLKFSCANNFGVQASLRTFWVNHVWYWRSLYYLYSMLQFTHTVRSVTKILQRVLSPCLQQWAKKAALEFPKAHLPILYRTLLQSRINPSTVLVPTRVGFFSKKKSKISKRQACKFAFDILVFK